MINRDYNNPDYKKARAAARKRDGYKCKICKSAKKLQIHHIKPYYLAPTLLSDLNNLITVCKVCHQRMWSKEESFAAYCLSLINDTGSIHDILKKYEEENGK